MKYICKLCGHVYDEEKEGVAFADLPDGWTCPLCGAPKSLFMPQEPTPSVSAEKPKASFITTSNAESLGTENNADGLLGGGVKAAIDKQGDLYAGLNIGQLAALCGNLARGCEKQTKMVESEQFRALARFFDEQEQPEEDGSVDASVESLAALILGDTESRYGSARAIAMEKNDRGALRVITWGERITNMLAYLLKRYEDEGEAFLKNTEIWVCTVCGFVYVGDEAPELCPVCKVPAWKFERIERRNS